MIEGRDAMEALIDREVGLMDQKGMMDAQIVVGRWIDPKALDLASINPLHQDLDMMIMIGFNPSAELF